MDKMCNQQCKPHLDFSALDLKRIGKICIKKSISYKKRKFNLVVKALKGMTIIAFSMVHQLKDSPNFSQFLGLGWKMARLVLQRDQYYFFLNSQIEKLMKPKLKLVFVQNWFAIMRSWMLRIQ